MLTSKEILRRLEENISTIKEFEVESIGVFGSHARDEAREDSDIDMVVRFKPGKKNFQRFMGLELFLEELFLKEVDLVSEENVKPEILPYMRKDVKYVKGLQDTI
ncbi:nucleotidyltransferase family protein [Bacillus sp. NPDC094106]|uniref:nucleotidyltransferase family protein n=1 Tax=Bacillus sp. NPDC094106 TaxID=3363949 RepID=UPI00380026C5